MSKNCLFCPKKESSITQKVLIKIFFNVISHLIYMIWLDLDVELVPDTGTPSVEAHWGAVISLFSKMVGGGVKNLKKWVTSFVNSS